MGGHRFRNREKTVQPRILIGGEGESSRAKIGGTRSGQLDWKEVDCSRIGIYLLVYVRGFRGRGREYI